MERISRLRALHIDLDLDAAEAFVHEAAASAIDTHAAWLHGDLHAKNIIVDRGVIVGVVDWGDICAGDIATDLGALWLLFDIDDHGGFWMEYGPVSPATELRARGSALAMGLMLVDSHYESDPPFAEAGRHAAQRTLR